MAYLIHANRWTLSQAYAFVLERRKGISPNIGFVSELMGFEQQELGSKSMGVIKPGSDAPPGAHGGRGEGEPASAVVGPSNGGMNGSYGIAANARRTAHVRESLPPMNRLESDTVLAGAHAPEQGLGEEMEIRDAAGRYRHFRRAPVNEQTLQPLRRVSKAGLESWD
jgi:hypothetical protein